MKLRPDEVFAVLKEELGRFAPGLAVEEVGAVIEVGDGIARLHGLRQAMAGEMLVFPHDIPGLVFNLETATVGAVILGDYLKLREGDVVRRTGAVLHVPAGEALLGRVVDPLGRPLDGRGPIEGARSRPIELPAPGVADRQPVDTPLQTGLKAVDAMIPIGRGQRELIIGDRQTGKTALAVDAILNQRGGKVASVYVAIGQKASTVADVVERLRRHDALDHTIVVAATSADPAALQYLAPYAGCAMAEEVLYRGGDALIVYDDLTRHAAAYRQLSLLLRRPPGREAYPGDVFYLHARLLERAARLAQERGGGSLTALPIIETQEGEVSAYIPTNLISITDGQIYLEPRLFLAGIRPAINVGISVSRVGGRAQIQAMKQVAGGLRLDLAQYWELESFARLGTELDRSSQARVERGQRLVELLKQGRGEPLPVADQVLALFAGTGGFLDAVPVAEVQAWEKGFLRHVHEHHPELRRRLRDEGRIAPELARQLAAAGREYQEIFAGGQGLDQPPAGTPPAAPPESGPPPPGPPAGVPARPPLALEGD